MKTDKPFWQVKSLADMTSSEWESLCDGCGKCCLQQLVDEDTERLVFTDVACDLLDQQSCRCSDYANRTERVPTCLSINPDNISQVAEFAPLSCAYRLLYFGEQLPAWHHLRSGNVESVHLASKSVQGRCRARSSVSKDQLEDYVVYWPLEK